MIVRSKTRFGIRFHMKTRATAEKGIRRRAYDCWANSNDLPFAQQSDPHKPEASFSELAIGCMWESHANCADQSGSIYTLLLIWAGSYP